MSWGCSAHSSMSPRRSTSELHLVEGAMRRLQWGMRFSFGIGWWLAKFRHLLPGRFAPTASDGSLAKLSHEYRLTTTSGKATGHVRGFHVEVSLGDPGVGPGRDWFTRIRVRVLSVSGRPLTSGLYLMPA